MNQLGKVRRLYYREGLTLSEIERRTGLTRKTIRRWLKEAEGVDRSTGGRPRTPRSSRSKSGLPRCWRRMRAAPSVIAGQP